MSINSFLSTISKQGGMSYANNFVVNILDAPASLENKEQMLEFFCDEAQLPNINTAEGSMNGLYLGSGQLKYPTTRVFTDFQLGFALDANLQILKFLNEWHDFIFGEPEGREGEFNRPQNRTNRLSYMDEYVSNILIQKTESGPKSTTERNPVTYVLERAYPYAIDAVPLQFGSTQITKVTAQFSYMRHYTINKDIRNVKDSNISAGGKLVGEVEIGPGIFKQQYLLPSGKIIEKTGNKVA